MNDLRRNFGLDLVRATEAAALAAGRWMGMNRRVDADRAASLAFMRALNSLDIDGRLVAGEEGKLGAEATLIGGMAVGNGAGPALDGVVDPLDGSHLLAHGMSGALSVAAFAPRGALFAPGPAVYMEKIIVDREVAHALVPECLGAPAAWTLALVARAKKRTISELQVFVLDRPRHRDLIEEIRVAGARVTLRADGDVNGALMAASATARIDLLMGIGGASEGVIAACAVKAMGGAMLARLAPQSLAEAEAVRDSGRDLRAIYSGDTLVSSDQIFFAATGITDGRVLNGVRFNGDRAETDSLVLRGETFTRRRIIAEHNLRHET